MSKRTFEKPSAEELRRKLTPLQLKVTQENGTEPPFHNEYWNEHRDGIYVDVATGAPLFSSRDKFDSGTGWPSFTKPIDEAAVVDVTDRSHGMTRVEVRSKLGDCHLGHLFPDGPAPRRTRYCINSASLRFIERDRLEAEGLGEYVALFSTEKSPAGDSQGSQAPATKAEACATGEGQAGCEATVEVAILAGGCFWGMQELLRKISGVIETEVGYAGGTTKNPTYAQVKTGGTGHAEAVKIVFDPKVLSFADLLETWFFRMHDPTTRDRQGNDVGSQYRSLILYTSPEQRRVAQEVIARIDGTGKWKRPIVTEVAEAGAFTRAEDGHQDYLQRYPDGYTCHWMRE